MTTLDATLTASTIPKSQVDYIMQWRELWADHVYWTRFAVMDIIDGAPGVDKTVARLMDSCSEMRDLLRPYYGDQAAEAFGDLMTSHLTLAAQLVTEASQGKSVEADATEKAWYENADQIAAFISSANPNLPEAVLRSMLDEHLRLTKDEAVARITKDWDGDIAAFNKILHQVYGMSDALADGIIKQFATRFV